MQLQRGQKLQLVGAPGSGKSLLLQTLAGHRKASAGHISWDGRSAPSIDALTDAVFLASENALIAGTLLDNLRLSNALLSDEQAWSALQQVGLSETVDKLGGLGIRLHSGGMSLSSSQRRQLILARALVAHPRLLLVDGALDFLSENNSKIIERFLGKDAPWSAIVVSNDPKVRAALAYKISANEGGEV
jgi:ABC-type bacteriocin/lantibiotic exporter with double-glycine peptidase domain